LYVISSSVMKHKTQGILEKDNSLHGILRAPPSLLPIVECHFRFEGI
jgi:hypothetical protein